MHRIFWPQTVAFFITVLLISMLVTVLLFVPSPSDFQFSIIRTVLSLASAVLASLLPAFVELKAERSAIFRAGGALAVFVVVYWFLPSLINVRPVTQTYPTPNAEGPSSLPQPGSA